MLERAPADHDLTRVRVTCRLLLVEEGWSAPAAPPDQRVLLISSANGQAWVTPGGTWEPRTGEELIGAAQREAQEEAGIAVEVERLMYLWLFSPPSSRSGTAAPAGVPVLELFFLAHPAPEAPEAADPARSTARSWEHWEQQDPDGPCRQVRWFSRAQLADLPTPVYPQWLRERFWSDLAEGRTGGRWPNPYLGFSPRSG